MTRAMPASRTSQRFFPTTRPMGLTKERHQPRPISLMVNRTKNRVWQLRIRDPCYSPGPSHAKKAG